MILRAATETDAPAMAALLNEIISIGGTTAHEDAVRAQDMQVWYLTGPDAVCAHVAVEDSRLPGFQVRGRHHDQPANRADIGTFVHPGVQRGGIGAALFSRRPR